MWKCPTCNEESHTYQWEAATRLSMDTEEREGFKPLPVGAGDAELWYLCPSCEKMVGGEEMVETEG